MSSLMILAGGGYAPRFGLFPFRQRVDTPTHQRVTRAVCFLEDTADFSNQMSNTQ